MEFRALDKRGLAALASGHAAADLCQGAVPALIPFLIAERGYSFGAAGALLLVVTVGSSIIQPVFGALSDRLALSWLMPVGVALAAIGVAGAGVAPTSPLTALSVGIGGLGVAAFHPEGARYANYASGTRRGTGMSFFSVGGNAGLRAGADPDHARRAGLRALGHAASSRSCPRRPRSLLAFELPHLKRRTARPPPRGARAARRTPTAATTTGARSARLTAVDLACAPGSTSACSPSRRVVHPRVRRERGGRQRRAGRDAGRGRAGTLVGGQLVDRIGRRSVLVGSIVAQIPLLLAFMLAPSELVAGVLLAAIGFVTVMSFSVSVVMGQEYLPSRLGIASGVTLGLAIGMGGIAAALLGVLADHTGWRPSCGRSSRCRWLGLALASDAAADAGRDRLTARAPAAGDRRVSNSVA